MKADMFAKQLIRSELVQVLDLGNGVSLCAHPLSGARIYITEEIANLIESFREPQKLSEWTAEQTLRYGGDRAQRAFSCVLGLLSEGILFDTALGDEKRYWATQFASNVANPRVGQSLRPARRSRNYDVSMPRSLDAYGGMKHQISALFFGACSAQLLLDFVRDGARSALIDVDARATIFQDVQLAAEAKPDVVVVGQFPEKAAIFEFPAWRDADDSVNVYIETARQFLLSLRKHTAAPALLLNVPTPTCSPLGIVDRGVHLSRARRLNLELDALSREIENVYIIDVDQSLGLEGRRGLIDDAVAGFGHLGSLPWLLHQYEHPHPGLESYSSGLGPASPALAREEFETERIISQQIVSMLLVLNGIGRKKCVVVDLDDTLWPGGLADNGEPFVGQPQFDVYPYGRYWGLHSALKALKARGLLLACVSKNDEEVVRRLWKYSSVPNQFFLTLDDFVTFRINWNEKSENIQDIARELKLGLDAFAFIDDNPVERAKVEHFLPEVMVLGADSWSLRWTLLTHHAFQLTALTAEGSRRTEMTRGQIDRDRAMASAADPAAFLKTLELDCTVERVCSLERLERMLELIDRTHQLNTTGKKWSRHELASLVTNQDVFTMSARDRFVDYGLVGVCVIEAGKIEIVVVSCRVLGLHLEHAFLGAVLDSLRSRSESIKAEYIPKERNLPARGLYAQHGFRKTGSNLWVLDLMSYAAPAHPHIRLDVRL